MGYVHSLLLSVFILFIGCSTATKQQTNSFQRTLPAWYLHPPKDDENFLYGVAIAQDRQSAINAALVDMISKLGVSISSTFETQEESYSTYYAHTTSKSDIVAEVEKITLNNYTVLKAQQVSYREFAVLVQTNKQQFAATLIGELTRAFDSFHKRYNSLQKSASFQKYLLLVQLYTEAKRYSGKIYIAKQLDPSFDANSLLDFTQKLFREAHNIQSSIKFTVHTDTTLGKKFIAPIEHYLHLQGFHTTKQSFPHTPFIDLHVKRYQVNSPLVIAIYKINITVVETKEQLCTNEITLKVRANRLQPLEHNKAVEAFTTLLETQPLCELFQTHL